MRTPGIVKRRPDCCSNANIRRLHQNCAPRSGRVNRSSPDPTRFVYFKGWDNWTRPTLLTALNDANAAVLQHALGTVESVTAPTPRLRERVVELTRHGDAHVRLAALLVAAPIEALPRLPVDEWEVAAIAIAAGSRPGTMLAGLIDSSRIEQLQDPVVANLLIELAAMAGRVDGTEQPVIALRALLSRDFAAVQRCLPSLLAEVRNRQGSIDALQQDLDRDVARQFKGTVGTGET